MIFDSHAHYDDEAFDKDRDELIKSLPSKGVSKVINCSVDIESSLNSINLAEKYDFIFAAIGIHPLNLDTINELFLEKLEEFSSHKKVVAIGEIGLDYHYDKTEKTFQKQVFEKQLNLANDLSLPVIIHNRDAHKDTLDLLYKTKPRGVIHCFSGSLEMANEIIKLGMYIGVGGTVTFKNAKNVVEVVRNIPLDRILLETDAPYLAPTPFRGQRNDSSLIHYVAEKISEIRGISKEEILKYTSENAANLFS